MDSRTQRKMETVKLMRPIFKAMLFVFLLTNSSEQIAAQELGHYIPGAWDIRSFISPPPGYYLTLYNYFYTSHDIKNQNGHAIQSINIRDAQIALDINVHNAFVAPLFIWAPKTKLMGADFAFMLLQPVANPSLQSSLQILNTGLSINQSSWGIADSYVRPLWFTWRWPIVDLSASYAFYAPTGRYRNLSRNNTGLGFWTHEFQCAGTWFPDKKHLLSVTLAGTYDFNQRKTDIDIRPGNYFSLNWGISQLFSIREKNSLEIGIPGYDQWQITNDSGAAVKGNPSIHDKVHAVGLQVGYTLAALNLVVTGKCLQEFRARSRFQGRVYTLSLSTHF
ncbi:hypothetical protein BEV13_05140 [Rickettsiella grylli]|nr:hypothetical protein BEV13_05140 [Rickettsiella grylli]